MSGKTMFRSWCKSRLGMMIEILVGSPTRENATYSWPCAKIGDETYMPRRCIVCDWLLCMVIPNAGLKGNWRRINLMSECLPSWSPIRGMKTVFPTWLFPVMIFATTQCGLSCVIVRRVPLARPVVGLRLRMRMIGEPILTSSLWKGKPAKVHVFMNDYIKLFVWCVYYV